MASDTRMHSVDSPTEWSLLTVFTFVVAAIAVGIVLGYLINQVKKPTTTASNSTTTQTGQNADTAGVNDDKTFKDKAEGTLKEGGIKGEGSFHLVRPGGDSQNVYLTSNTVDLSKFVGKKVRVKGQTIDGQYAGWLMDVGWIEVLH